MYGWCKTALLRFSKVKHNDLLKVWIKLNYQTANIHLAPKCLNQESKKSKSKKLFTMKLNSPQFEALFTEEVKELQRLFNEHNYELRIAGGAVRDLLLGKDPKDLDFATTATPTQMKEMFVQHNVRLINNNGEKHGTITPRINDKENFEVTTLRIDVVTDGRHAEVQFTTDWMLDAERRDLTINSMFLGLDGTIYDYFNGYEDLKNKHVVFVGDPHERILEDYLRILRYFRFYGRIAANPDNHDVTTLKALRHLGNGLANISGERIWMELSKILTGGHAGELIEAIMSLGLGPYIGLPQPCDLNRFREVWHKLRKGQVEYNPVTLLSGLMASEEDMLRFHARVKLSAFERDLGIFLVNNREDMPHLNPIRPYQLLVVHSKGKLGETTSFVKELFKYRGDMHLLQEFDKWVVPRFPVNGHLLREKGVSGGKHMGFILKKLKDIWVENDFQMGADQLLEHVPDLMQSLGTTNNVRNNK